MSANPRNTSGQQSFEILQSMIQEYFDGLYYADTEKLRRIFHRDTVLKAPGLRRTRDEWLEQVANRPVPSEVGSPYGFRLISLEVVQDQAMAKVECPLFDFSYVDFLGFLRENGQWMIVSKMYVDTKAEQH
ncbi:hypothetical protein BTA51_11095 [Hahella sp. CCB-MM4]|uniref:nuclear transport factor 2 family protein n=1 Tax=Hahella sp. (strain CCB-MM4) TaxID=1926491 RepID=UPI000B9A9095|nr:nuclear transport factor 2 family protein [Hahella sp. CCB-MM4]OZG73543.1 hypothetical protein BTA51_11095 [Hahella sp. CCB-MM4]